MNVIMTRHKLDYAAVAACLPLALVLAVFLVGAGLSVIQSFGLLAPIPSPSGWSILSGPRLWAILGFSAWVALVSASIATLAGALLATAIWRLPEFLPAPLVRLALVYKVPLILPHLSVGFIILVLLSGSGPIAAICARLGWIATPQDFPDLLFSGYGLGMIAAYAYKETPFALLLCLASLRRLDPRQVQTARMLGASPWMTFRRVVLPHLRPASNAVFVILFLYSFGAFDIPFVVGESVPGMAGVRIWQLYFMSDLADRPQALSLATAVLAFSVGFVWVYLKLAARVGDRERKL